MPTQSYIVATAGHVDHGKSALVHALTGTDPDRLPEEKARGITIDLGFAHAQIAGPAARDGGAPATFHLGIVDVPGHEDFVKNMVAGVGSIDLALLVVDANEGWMPQTEEHLQILTYLGVTRGVVAMTKVDLCADADAARDRIRQRLAGTPLAEAPIVATSVVTGRGLDELRLALAEQLASTPPQRDVGKPRLSVDRAFTLRGVGTVVTGTLIGGSLRKGQAVIVQPALLAAKVRTLQSHNREVESIAPGSRVAVNVPDLQVAERGGAHGQNTIGRGDVITTPELGRAAEALDVVLERTARAIGPEGGAGRVLKDGVRVRVHHGSTNVPARLALLARGELAPGGRALAQLRLESPLFAMAGDRFIIRDWSEQQTLAGGVILDPEASPVALRTDSRREHLQTLEGALASGDIAAVLVEHLKLARAGEPAALLRRSRFAPAEIANAIEQLVARGAAVRAGAMVVDARWWSAVRKHAAAAVDAEHAAHPERAGLALSELRGALEAMTAGTPDVFDALVNEMTAHDGFVRAGAALRRATHRPALPPHLQPAGARIRAALHAKPFDPPSRKELSPDNIAFQAMKFLLTTGEAMAVGDELVLHVDHYQRAVELIRKHLNDRGAATVSDLKQALGTSRRVMVPLLEKLDRDGVTVRRGDQRVLRGKVG